MMLGKDEQDSNDLGRVGFMSEQMKTEAPFWRLVCTLRLSPKELDTWTLNEMRMADSFMAMQMDYKRIWGFFYENQRKNQENEEIEDDGSFGNLQS